MGLFTSMINTDQKRSMSAAVMLGIGVMATLDEIIFHQLLSWHHFFDWSTPAFGLFSDGLLHSAELILLVFGSFLFADLLGRHALKQKLAWAGFFFGMGGFQLFDGIIDHKLLGLHQVRYVNNVLPYDIAWNVFGLLLLVLGYIILRRVRDNSTKESDRSSK